MPAPEIIHELVAKFSDNRDAYRSGRYNEAQLRMEFLDKFFEALGWDIYNRNGYSPEYRDVVIEDSLAIEGTSKSPDYTFKIGKERKFYVEAKKPSVDIQYDIHPAYQLRRYAWNAHLPLSVLTDFEEFSIYNCKNKPNPSDSAATGRDKYYRYTEYVEKWDEIASIFSRDAVWKGSFDRFAESSKGKKGTTEVDDAFLEDIEKWRKLLAYNIALRNSQIKDEGPLNYAVQMTIDRIIFLRICEDKGIETEEQLKSISKNTGIYDHLIELFKRADVKYNSGLFHFTKEKGNDDPADRFTPGLKIDDKVLKEIINDIYYPCPYIFKEIPVEILGQVYEQFLGKVIRLTEGHQARIEEKPEVRKAGGVYYTPKYIVDYIVQNTVGKLVEGKTPEQAIELKIVDPACGSGSFLLGAYQYLLDWHIKWYIENDPEKWAKGKNPAVVLSSGGGWKLTTSKRKEILVNNIYGVDIDAQAVEVTKLSLLLKVLEEESGQLSLGLERALPDLGKNIQCGNSLIGWDYFEGQLTFDEDEKKRINPFDWQRAFPQVFAQGGFDAVIGNPPYLKEANNKDDFRALRNSKYKRYCMGKMDLWYVFASVALDITKENGFHSFIATNNWVTNYGAQLLRNKILQESRIVNFIDFSDFHVFQDASIQTMIYIVIKSKSKNPYFVDFLKIFNQKSSEAEIANRISNPQEKSSGWEIIHFFPERNYQSISFSPIDIESLLQKIEANAIGRFQSDEIGNGIDVLQDFVTASHLKKLKPQVRKGDGIFVVTNKEKEMIIETDNDARKIKPYYTTKELGRYRSVEVNNYWIIYADREVRENIKKYPGIKSHLDKFKPVLTSVFAPYGLHRPRNEDFYLGEKILSQRKTRNPEFSYTTFPSYVSRAFMVIKPKNHNESMKFFLGLLNSRLIEFWLYQRGKKQGDQLQIDKEPLCNIPLVEINFEISNQKSLHDKLVILVNNILTLHKRTSATPQEQEQLTREIATIDDQIDKLVYQLYGLTDEEIKVIEGG